MKVTFFGTGSATPHLERHPSACLVEVSNESILIDCGEGTQYRLLKHKVKHTRIKTICISHLHGDHYFGLVGLLSSWNLGRRTQGLKIFAPKGLEKIIELQLNAANSKFTFPIEFIEIKDRHDSLLYDHKDFEIRTLPLIHRVFCSGFTIRCKPGLRKIISHKLPENFPVAFFKLLQNGKDVYDELNDLHYPNEDYTQQGKQEKSFAYCSDTAFNTDLIPLIKNVNLLYHEATFGTELLERATLTQHSTAAQAASIASDANVGLLLLGHFSSRYKDLEPLLKEARHLFDNSELVEQGKVYEI